MRNGNDQQLYLAASTKIEPLCSKWYAWSHLVSPVQRALNVTFRQLPLLRSFIASPAVHEVATSDSTLMGGSFVHLRKNDLPAVRALVQEMTARCASLIRFAEDLLNFDRQLQATATGANIDHLYESLPPALAGALEITYDLNNHPTLRVIEELLYDSDLSGIDTQALAFSRTRDEQRKFFLNTPRVDEAERFIVPTPFAAGSLSLLAGSRVRPTAFAELVESLGIEPASEARFREFFTPHAPVRNAPQYRGDDVRLRYFGHACVLLQTSTVSILIDPLFAWDEESGDKLVFNDLPDFIDYVFLTHNHHDHFSPEVLLQIRDRIGRILVPRNNANTIADPSMKLALKSLGFNNVDVMDPLDRVTFDDGYIVSLPFYGEHAALSINSKHGMYVNLKGRRMAFLADSNCLDRMLYRRVVERLGKVETLFIGMECQGAPLTWMYGPYLTNAISRKDDESRRSNGSDCDRAWALLEELGSTRAFVYAMGQEPWFRYHLDLIYTPDSKQIIESDKFVERCRSAAIPCERLNGCREMMF
ncbi:MBL fold metallo-hydrolase [Dyella tabacisoli]|uniref:MBL fold metallo-hydrolase n=1 Tax=Dyella tabacisoli TaxID=2282381 RepID=A0A369ULF6_9GAMM|nr:MBL fold metallo-hydrolase [Dyella tabacisoli]RDD80430.1 MBL fold metallo-hydrolase [Dyella tabacisoli]